MFATTLYFNF